jgi:hypothetical protein
LLKEIEDDVLSERSLAGALRKCIVLGGRAGSVALRDWANQELRGYGNDDEVPDYRTVGALIRCNAIAGNTIITGQHFGSRGLPDYVQEHVSEEYTFRVGVGQLEAMAGQAEASENHAINLSLPGADLIAAAIDQEVGNPFQHITALYWSVSSSSIRGVLDQIRTTLAGLVAEMTAGLPVASDTPSAELATQAVNVAVHGNKSRVHVTSASATDQGVATVGQHDSEAPFWTRSKRIAAIVVGVATVIAAVPIVVDWLK